jgi:hypothetical protein
MDTAQLLLSQGNQTQQTQTVATAVTTSIAWIALGTAAVLIVILFLKGKK